MVICLLGDGDSVFCYMWVCCFYGVLLFWVCCGFVSLDG